MSVVVLCKVLFWWWRSTVSSALQDCQHLAWLLPAYLWILEWGLYVWSWRRHKQNHKKWEVLPAPPFWQLWYTFTPIHTKMNHNAVQVSFCPESVVRCMWKPFQRPALPCCSHYSPLLSSKFQMLKWSEWELSGEYPQFCFLVINWITLLVKWHSNFNAFIGIIHVTVSARFLTKEPIVRVKQ